MAKKNGNGADEKPEQKLWKTADKLRKNNNLVSSSLLKERNQRFDWHTYFVNIVVK